MNWSINNIDNYVTNVEGDCVISYSLQGYNSKDWTITKHELSIDNGESYSEITPEGNDTGFHTKVNSSVEMKRCYIRMTLTEVLSPQTDPESQLHPPVPKVITQTSNMFTVQYNNPKTNNVPEIMNIKVLNINESGTYEIHYSASDKDEKDVLKHFIKIDKEEYKEIIPTLNEDKTFKYMGVGLEGGDHICQIKISDGQAETESVVFEILIPNIKNKPPTISTVTVSDTSYTGLYKLTYEANDENISDNLIHKLKIDTGDFIQITPISMDNKYIYNGSELGVGNHKCQISISDGVNPEVLSKEFDINIPQKVDLKIKEELFNSKSEYDLKYKGIIDTINKVINDIKTVPDYNLETGNTEITTKFDEYTLSSVKFKDVMQKAIDSIAGKKTNDAKESLNKEIGDLSNALGSLDNTMNDVFKDGILTEAERISIKQELQRLSLEKADVDNQYKSLLERFNKVDLDRGNKGDSNKTWYSKIYNDYKTIYAEYDKEYKSLVTVIDFIARKEGIIDSSDKAKMDEAFDRYVKVVDGYSKQANLAIEAIARNESENNEIFKQEWKAEYIRNNEENSAALSKLTEKDKSFELDMSKLKQTASEISTTVEKHGTDIESQKTSITQLSSSISSKVSAGQVGSIISQKPNEIMLGLSKKNIEGYHYVTIEDKGRTTIWNGYLACDKLTTPEGHDPIISLFGDKHGVQNCSIDATYMKNWGIGSNIRLKYTDDTYIRIGKDKDDGNLKTSFFFDGIHTCVIMPQEYSYHAYIGSPQSGIKCLKSADGVQCRNGSDNTYRQFAASNFVQKASITYSMDENAKMLKSVGDLKAEESVLDLINKVDVKVIDNTPEDKPAPLSIEEENKSIKDNTILAINPDDVNTPEIIKCPTGSENEYGISISSLSCLNTQGIQDLTLYVKSLEDRILKLENGGTK